MDASVDCARLDNRFAITGKLDIYSPVARVFQASSLRKYKDRYTH